MGVALDTWVVIVTYIPQEAIVGIGPQGVGVPSNELKAVL